MDMLHKVSRQKIMGTCIGKQSRMVKIFSRPQMTANEQFANG
jgi:hypothetical protein